MSFFTRNHDQGWNFIFLAQNNFFTISYFFITNLLIFHFNQIIIWFREIFHTVYHFHFSLTWSWSGMVQDHFSSLIILRLFLPLLFFLLFFCIFFSVPFFFFFPFTHLFFLYFSDPFLFFFLFLFSFFSFVLRVLSSFTTWMSEFADSVTLKYSLYHNT